MDTSGRIRMLEEYEEPKANELLLREDDVKRLLPISPKRRKNWMRNQLCSCGSGKKFKKCCWSKMAAVAKIEGR